MTVILPADAWPCLIVGAVLIGIAKTAVNGAGILAVILFAVALPTRQSTGTLLPLLIAGDVIAVLCYRRHADWRALGQLLPGLVPGFAAGWWFLRVADDDVLRRVLGTTLVVVSGLQLWQMRRPAEPVEHRGAGTPLALGGTAGFASMTANAAGPITTLYLLRAGLAPRALLGTAAWFYALANLLKVPFSASLHLITPDSIVMDIVLLPALAVGSWSGLRLVARLRRRGFEVTVLVAGALSAVALLI